MKYTLASIINGYQSGERFKYLFFWGHRKKRMVKLDNLVLVNGGI
ncbi:MAG: hypothetical protein P1U70_10615 [Saprospiraceae bacterium]|jgi:hypothetical protein|nr:hypothetical protein [Saprospiraceae bacterium]